MKGHIIDKQFFADVEIMHLPAWIDFNDLIQLAWWLKARKYEYHTPPPITIKWIHNKDSEKPTIG